MVEERSPGAVDTAMAALDGTVVRSLADVEAEIAARRECRAHDEAGGKIARDGGVETAAVQRARAADAQARST